VRLYGDGSRRPTRHRLTLTLVNAHRGAGERRFSVSTGDGTAAAGSIRSGALRRVTLRVCIAGARRDVVLRTTPAVAVPAAGAPPSGVRVVSIVDRRVTGSCPSRV
jgi:hypothetical protein